MYVLVKMTEKYNRGIGGVYVASGFLLVVSVHIDAGRAIAFQEEVTN